MNDDWKIVFEDLAGKQITEWMTEKLAREKFEAMKGPELTVIWAELIHSPVDEPEPEWGETVVDSFTYRVVEIGGSKLIVK